MEFLLDVIYKDLYVTQAILQKDFKFGLDRGYQDLGFNLALMLWPSIQGFFLEKCDGKWNSVATLGPRCSKIVFAFLYEVIAIYVRLAFIDV